MEVNQQKQIVQGSFELFADNNSSDFTYKRTSRPELSFVGEKLIRERHKIHPYPAMLHPLLVKFLIENYAKPEDVIFDPFCGSGVALLESSVAGHKSVGFDINPLALLIARAKTKHYDIKELKDEFFDFKRSLFKNKETDIPLVTNIEYWYAPDVVKDLGRIRRVLKIKDYRYKDFFTVCFAFICRNQSFTRKGEFKRYRLKKEKVESFKNKVFERLLNHIEAMIGIIENSTDPKTESFPLLLNSENTIPEITYDLVITSPPYGDSRTTVAYGEYSSFGIEWVDDLNSFGGQEYKVDKESIGRISMVDEDIRKHSLLIDTVKKIENMEKKRANEVFYFFNGYYKAIKNIVKSLNTGGRVCFVVGNRTVKGCNIPMDQITASFLDGLGLHFGNIFVRDILNKIMPSQNSPTNIAGEKSKTMSKEYIVVFNKN